MTGGYLIDEVGFFGPPVQVVLGEDVADPLRGIGLAHQPVLRLFFPLRFLFQVFRPEVLWPLDC